MRLLWSLAQVREHLDPLALDTSVSDVPLWLEAAQLLGQASMSHSVLNLKSREHPCLASLSKVRASQQWPSQHRAFT
jgi:hypothetical protein